MKKLKELVSTYKDYPREGVEFKDVLGIIQEPKIFKDERGYFMESFNAKTFQEGIGQKVKLFVGGKVDDKHGDPVEIEGVVKNITDGIWEDSEIRHGGYTKYNQGKTALIETDKRGSIILTTLRQPPQSIGQITHIDECRRVFFSQSSFANF